MQPGVPRRLAQEMAAVARSPAQVRWPVAARRLAAEQAPQPAPLRQQRAPRRREPSSTGCTTWPTPATRRRTTDKGAHRLIGGFRRALDPRRTTLRGHGNRRARVTSVLAADLGGTRLKACLVSDLSAGPVTVEPSADLTGPEAVALLIETARAVTGPDRIDAFGLAVPGLVDAGRIFALPGKFPGLTDIDLAAALGEAMKVPAVVMNDAVAAALGEAVAGAGRGHARMAMLTIGTGVGTAVIENGMPLGNGPLGGGLLAGQMPMPGSNDHADTSGRSDTMEAAIAAPRLLALAHSSGLAVDSLQELASLARADDAATADVVATYRADLATACVSLVHAYAPSVLVIGGGPATGDARWLTRDLQAAVSARLWPGVHCDITTAELGDAAALIGVAAAATAQLNAPTYVEAEPRSSSTSASK